MITDEFKLLETLGKHLKIDEGMCNGFYICPAGKLSCGAGHNIEARPLTKRLIYKWLKYGMSDTDVDTLLVKDMLSSKAVVDNKYGHTEWFNAFNDVQKLGWYNMAYQMGVYKQSKFTNSIRLLQEEASAGELYVELMDSSWFNQTPERAERVSTMIAYGQILDYYEFSTSAIIQPTLITA